MIKVLTRSLMPQHGVRWKGMRKFYAMCRHGSETLVFYRPRVAPKIETQYHYVYPRGRPLKQDPFFPWEKIRSGTYEVWARTQTPSNKTRGRFYVFKDGDEKPYAPDEFWQAIIGDMT